MARLKVQNEFQREIPLSMPIGTSAMNVIIVANLLFVPRDSIKDLSDLAASRMICAGIPDVRDAATGQSLLDGADGQSAEAIRNDLLDGDHGMAIASRMVMFYVAELPLAIGKNSGPSPSP